MRREWTRCPFPAPRDLEDFVRNRAIPVPFRILMAALGTWLLLHSPADLAAQSARTMVGGQATYGGYGAVVFKGTEVNDQFGGFFGARGGWLIDHVFSLGAGGYVLGGGVDVEDEFGKRSLSMWYGGAEIEFISGWSQVYHITFLTLIGGGSLGLEGESDGIWAVEPALNVEINVTPYMRLDFGGGYRFIWDVDVPDLSNGDLSQFFGLISLKFGAF